MSKKVKFIGLSQQLTDLLIKHNLKSCRDVLNKSNLELMLLLRVNIQSANEILNKASKAISPSPSNVLEMMNNFNMQKQHTKGMLVALDHILYGCIRSGLLTEVAGPPGCGKTQFCMMLAVIFITLNETENKSVLFIDTEGSFDADRLIEIACHKYPEKYKNAEQVQSLASRIVMYKEKQFKDLTSRLENLEEEIITTRAGLVIIDSIASPVRREFDAHHLKSIYERNKALSQQASLLKFFASEYNFPVILTNQITTQFQRNDTCTFKSTEIIQRDIVTADGMDEAPTISDSNVVVALGTHWSHCVHARIVLQYSAAYANIREMHLIKSPSIPYVKLYYTVDSTGIAVEGEGDFSSSNNLLNLNTKLGLPL